MKNKWIRYNRHKYFFSLSLILLLVGLAIGYAFVGANISIEGIVGLSRSGNWSVYLDNYQAMQDSVAPVSTPTVTNTTVSFSAVLNEPGDFFGFTIDVVNDGEINADLALITLTPDFSNIDYGEATITYSDDTPVAVGDILAKNKTKTIKVIINYIEDAESYPTTNQTYNVTLTLGYEQYVGDVPCKVTLDPGEDGSVSPSVLNKVQGDYATDLPTPTRTDYAFDGWYTSADDGDLVDDNTVIDGDVTYYAHWYPANAVAKIGDIYYTSFSTAMNNIPNTTETTVKLYSDITVSSTTTFANTKNVILDFNGHTITNTGTVNTFVNNGRLTLKNGTVVCTNTSSTQGAINNNKNAIMIVDGMTIDVRNKRQTFYNKGGNLTIKGNSVLTTTSNSARATLNNLNDGSVQGVVTILSATITSPNNAAINSTGGSVTIGSDDSTINATDPVLQGYTYALEITGGSADVYDGLLKGKTDVSTGNVTYHGSQVTGTELIDPYTYNTLYLE